MTSCVKPVFLSWTLNSVKFAKWPRKTVNSGRGSDGSLEGGRGHGIEFKMRNSMKLEMLKLPQGRKGTDN